MKSLTKLSQDVNGDRIVGLKRFFGALFHKIPESERLSLYLELPWLPASGEAERGLPAKAFPLTDSGLKQASQEAIELNANSNVYYGLNPRGEAWGNKGAHACADEVATIIGFCIDDPPGQLATLQTALPPPSFVVETSPGKVQGIWLLREPVFKGNPDWDRALELQGRLKHYFKAEAGDIVRVLRCPFTVNHKYPDQPVAGLFVVRGGQLTPWDGDPERLYRYLLQEFEWAAAPIETKTPQAEGRERTRVSYKNLPLGGKRCLWEAFKNGVWVGIRNEAGITLASELRKHGKTQAEALEILRKWNARNWASPDPDRRIEAPPEGCMKAPLNSHELEQIVKSAYEEHGIYDYGCNSYRNLFKIDRAFCEEKCEWLKKAREQVKGRGPKEKEFQASIWRTFDCIEGLGVFVGIARDRRRATFIDQNGTEQAAIRFEDALIRPPCGVEVQKGLVLYPTDIEDYTSIEKLLQDLIDFYKQYYEAAKEEDYLFMALYALTTWFAPRLPAVPILNFEGPSSKGKSRGSEVVWLTCAYPYRSSGTRFASWVRTVDRYFISTLLINEADFDRRNPETEELIKFYNVRPVRSEAVIQRMTDNRQVQSFTVFGPTISTTRQPFDDDAIERRTFKIRPKALGSPPTGCRRGGRELRCLG